MLRDIQSKRGSKKVLGIIQRVALALRPLTFAELGYILACMEEKAKARKHSSRSGAGTETPPKTKEETMQYVRYSLSFLRATTTHVSIVHHTAKEYLSDKSYQDGLPILPKSEFDLTASWECFRYLHRAFGGPERPRKGNERGYHDRSLGSSSNGGHQEKPAEAPREVAWRDLQEAMDKRPYLRYSAESWFLHARRSIEIAENRFCEDLTRDWLQYQFFGTSDVIRKPWIEICGNPKMEILVGDQTPLHVAVCLGLTPLVKKALPDFDAETKKIINDRSPLHLAVRSTSRIFKLLIAEGSLSLLIVQDKCGNTPLHEAAKSGNRTMLEGLMERFANNEDKNVSDQINKQNGSGNTPLHLAVQFDYPDIVKYLVENHADRTIKNGDQMTASELGAKLGRGESLEIFIKQAEEIAEGPVEIPVEETREVGKEAVEAPTQDLVGAAVVEARNEPAAVAVEGTVGETSGGARMVPTGVPAGGTGEIHKKGWWHRLLRLFMKL
ncbi:ankyrin [Tuber magnatum]|uniref:Ankyrin n=1 Tax=Tuber magnatum TaxID=42249 RepID=A0A317SUF7_9PEZI|nr:ankyrin [Tuber magnatum]